MPVGVTGGLAREAHALCAIGTAGQLPVTSELLDTAPSLEVVFVPSAGTDAIDVAAATGRGIAVVNAAGNNYLPVAEHTVGLMLSCHRRIAICDRRAHHEKSLPQPSEPGRAPWISPSRAEVSADASQGGGGRRMGHASTDDNAARRRAGPAQQVAGFAGHGLDSRPGILRGKTIGLVGFGYIGREVARICRTAFAMRVLAFDPYFHPTEAERQDVELVADIDAMLPHCDVVSVHSPLTPQTRRLIDDRRIATMKPTAVLVNTSRGGAVDTDALVHALRRGTIACAALDVADPEPLPTGHPLFDLDNAVLTPHIAGVAPESPARAGDMSTRDTLRALRGERPLNLVNPEVWSSRSRHVRRIEAL